MSAEKARITALERKIYDVISRSDGIKARDIAPLAGTDRTAVNRALYSSPLLRELCVQDEDALWHGIVRRTRPHTGLWEYSGWYGSVSDFRALSEEQWLAELTEGCRRVGRSLSDSRGLFHSFRDCRETVLTLLEDLEGVAGEDWELCFELRLNRARYIRLYADVLVITEDRVFSLEFKMKDAIEPAEVEQSAKYAAYLELLFGEEYDVISCLVLTRAHDLYCFEPLPGTDGVIPVCSGDMLFNVFDEYMGFLR